MAKRRRTSNPAQVKAERSALDAHPPREESERRLAKRRRLTILLMCLLTVVLLSVSFVPFGCWYLAYVALVPWVLALASGRNRRWALLCASLAGLLYWALSLYWLTWITLAGYAAVVVYLTAYWLVAALMLRAAIRRNMPVWAVLPVVWVALEYARAYVISGFPWFYLAHSQFDRTRLIQIADLTGQYGVSFFVAMVNGLLVDVFSSPLFVRSGRGRAPVTRRILIGLGAVCLAAAAMLGYGTWRLGQQTTSPGPVIGICQQAFPISLSGEPKTIPIFRSHLESSRNFTGKGCDLVIWPETMLPEGLYAEYLEALARGRSGMWVIGKSDAEQLGELSRRLDCPLLVGGTTMHEDIYAQTERDRWVRRNSALWFDRSWESRQVYSKRHLVPFSEYVPFKASWPWLHRVLRAFVPAQMPQLAPGPRYTRFALERKGSEQGWLIAAPICYEGTFPRICRAMVMDDGTKKVHVLANLSNDGWFIWQQANHRSTENEQHLVQYCFRAVENRVPVVRAVNTGISASIDSNGRIVAEVQQYETRVNIAGQLLLDGGPREEGQYALRHGPQVLVDSRVSVYSLVGDVFAMGVGVAAAGLAALLLWKRRSKDKEVTAK